MISRSLRKGFLDYEATKRLVKRFTFQENRKRNDNYKFFKVDAIRK
jgi:hypothetical protein